MRRRVCGALAIAAVAVFGAGAGVALAAPAATPTRVIHACVSNSTHVLKITRICTSRQHAIQWNIRGLRGLRGARGPAGAAASWSTSRSSFTVATSSNYQVVAQFDIPGGTAAAGTCSLSSPANMGSQAYAANSGASPVMYEMTFLGILTTGHSYSISCPGITPTAVKYYWLAARVVAGT